jgi:peptide/nickel transport system ATP-binding protein/oligopeptide transport system ATP-binding protein
VSDFLLRVEGLRKVYPVRRGPLARQYGEIRAVDGVSFSVEQAKTVALVGESGCGKSTVARCILRLIEPTAGRILFGREEVQGYSTERLRSYRQQVQIVFQEPFATLNPRMTVSQLISEPMRVHGLVERGRYRRAEAVRALELVGLSSQQAHRYPHEFSGGQRQRIAIARALVLRPKMIILDEPVAALDVSIAAQILKLLCQLQEELGVAYLVISHDLSLVRQIADKVAVMYLGALVETGEVRDLFETPQHPYTQALLSAVPIPDPVYERGREIIPLSGEVPDGVVMPSGCRFNPRCFKAQTVCSEIEPPLEAVDARNHRAACWFAEPMEVL